MAEWTPDRIKRLREAYGLTQDEFAERLRVGVGTLRAWEQPKARTRPPGPATIALDVLAVLIRFVCDDGC